MKRVQGVLEEVQRGPTAGPLGPLELAAPARDVRGERGADADGLTILRAVRHLG